MKDIVNVVRYVRPDWFDPERGNMYGITIDYELNYPEKMVKARWSVCNNENFSRGVGLQEAQKNDYLISFPLEDVDMRNGLTNALILTLHNLPQIQHYGYTRRYAYKHGLFSKSLRKLKQGN